MSRVTSSSSGGTVNIQDSSGNPINSTAGSVNVDLTTPIPAGSNAIGSITNTSFQVTQTTGANLHVDVDNFPATQPVSGTVTVVQPTGTNLHTVVDSGTITTITNPVTVTGTVAATQSGAWSVTANAGTNLNTSALALDTSVKLVQGPVTPGTVASNSTLIGAQYNTTLPSPTNGQQVALQTDNKGRLITAGPIPGSLTDGSGHVAASGAFQIVFVANPSRKYLLIQNIDSNGGMLCIDFGTSPNNLKGISLGPYGSFVMEDNFICTDQINIAGLSGTTTDFSAKQG